MAPPFPGGRRDPGDDGVIRAGFLTVAPPAGVGSAGVGDRFSPPEPVPAGGALTEDRQRHRPRLARMGARGYRDMIS
jgi:hypothetical protein